MAQIPELNDIVLTFDPAEAPDLADVEVRCKSVSLKRARVMDAWLSDPGGYDKYNRTFVEEVIISWNLEKNGEAVPVSMEAVDEMPPWVLRAMSQAWNRGLLTPPKA